MNYTDISYKVHVVCMTYNHSKFIRDALDGFCKQETDFPFICSIVDDASTDGQQSLIKKFVTDNFDIDSITVKESEYAHIIFAHHKINKYCYFAVLFLKYNHYGNAKLRALKESYLDDWRRKCTYEAVCEGDDYWIDNKKLQLQYETLEANPEYGMCYSLAKIRCGNNFTGISGTSDCTFDGLLKYSNFPTLTRFYKLSLYNSYMDDIYKYSEEWQMGDYPFSFYCILMSKVFFWDELTGVYRVLENSASHSNDIDYLIKFYESSDKVRTFFIENYIKDSTLKGIYLRVVNRRSANYKIRNRLYNDQLILARKVYNDSVQYLTVYERVIYRLIFLFPFSINIRSLIKSISSHF